MSYCWALYPFLLITIINVLHGRSVYRSQDTQVPCIEVYSTCYPQARYTFCDSHIKKIIFNLYDDTFFKQHILPMKPICFRHQLTTVHGHTLSILLQKAVNLIKNNSTKKVPIFEDFIILKAKDVNKDCTAGCYILKYKDYPFVAKIFVSSPAEILRCDNKGFEQLMLYYISGGTTRHLMGFSRIKNMQHVYRMIAHHPYWSQRIAFPRKWFWLPEQPCFLVLNAAHVSTTLPQTYALICDYIEWEYTFSIFNACDRQEAIALSNYLHHCIDSHIDNFGIEKKTKKLVIIDFEYFPPQIFNRTHAYIHNYFEWYKELILKVLCEVLTRHKYRRILDFYT